jgi:Na+/melibiose symporter-like transporter
MLLYFIVGINIYYTVFIKEILNISPSLASIFPGIASLSMIFSVFFIIPKLRNRNLYSNITIGILLSISGWCIFLISPAGNLVILGISSAVTALGTSITNPFKDTVLNNSIGEKERAKLFSLGQSFVSFAMIPSGIIAGILYRLNPSFPFILMVLLTMQL